MMRSAVLLPLFLLAAACATLEQETAETRKRWEGATYDDVVKRWGAPARSATLQDGAQVHTWVADNQTRYVGGGPTVGVGAFGGSHGRGGGVGFSFPFGSSSSAVETTRCERNFTFRNGVLAQQSWVGDPAFCNTFTR